MRSATQWGIGGLGLMLLVAWIVSAADGRAADEWPARLERFVPRPIDETGEARDRAIFSEVRRAQALAASEARDAARESGGPLSPSAGGGERSPALAAEAMERIALAYELTPGALKTLYLRGEAAGWDLSTEQREVTDGTIR